MLSRKSIALVFVLLLGSCGYHLRGAVDLPEQLRKVYLANASSSLREQFTKSLKSSSGQVVGSSAQAGMVVNILNERMDRRVLSLSNTGKANEFELNYSLDFQLLDATGAVLLDRQTIEINRDYFNDQEAIIAKTNEEAVIRSEMYQQAVRAIVDRARAHLTSR
ncbi:MAG: LPS-assembly lipoprotein LptE [Gammaproteobacteria bacterium]